eukprot:CAMPEP_0202972756 /NCGR_PEP_ID=MMETSP1396-20130829/41007_1 /ASSEMBLY_ACC=CAM_ASM_000872 /TAXON_ID= /ORGANISM="Pseudokeronopsis sp., Strain Brazil" /LENGTH=136 /DNA_ID=CAMNT_0049703629 /DNA_START=383 /DNA_END=793 /DNA_ORIENTATION=+
MANFIMIFAVVVVAFAFAFMILGRNHSEGQTLESLRDSIIYSYLIPMGDYDSDSFSDRNIGTSWFFFFLTTLITNIMLLNLLISIVSDTFARIKEQYDVIMYKDMLQVINENRLFYWNDNPRVARGQYLFICKPKS